MNTQVREFDSGASRNAVEGKLAYEGFLSFRVLQRFAIYMHKHRYLEDGSLRNADNWQRGIPRDVYMDSAWRHFMALWAHHRGEEDHLINNEGLEDALCGLMFNIMGYLHEMLRTDDIVSCDPNTEAMSQIFEPPKKEKND